MLYTLLKFLGWGALLALIGGCIGWALRALKCRGEIARATSSAVDDDEVERMRHRLANLEQVVAERDRLRIQLADVRHADSPGIVGAEVPEPPTPDPQVEAEPEQEPAGDADVEAPPELDDPAEMEGTDREADGERLSIVRDIDIDDSDVAGPDDAEPDDAEPDAGGPDIEPSAASSDASIADESAEPLDLDLDAAAEVLGKKITLDDLTVVEGIGPKISELCSGIGLTTWRQLADADVDDLQSMLDAAGSRYTVHKPGKWPRQAELLAAGRWADFKSLTDDLDGGK